ncbi:ATP-binding protein [Candidatus Woesearchaeota archaeon]|nr:ATP-binding protein [Candidatus Woesearchaeota archaeon]
MEPVFEEWNVYASKKELKHRAVDFDSITSMSKLKIIALTGVRRSGKSSLLILLHQKLSGDGKKVAYINLEDGRIRDKVNILDDILKWFGDKGYLLLDEITSVADYESWLARNHEMLKGSLRLIVSSSRRSLVVPNKPLRGRLVSYEMYPLSFKEFLAFKTFDLEKTTAGIGRIEKQLDEYLKYGGFPEVVLLGNRTDKVTLLNSYFKDIIGLDVAEISKENISTVELFGKYVLNSPYFSASKCLNFFKSVGYKIAKQSLLYLENYSQEGYLFFFVPIFSHTIKDRSQYPRKAYAGDTGFLYPITGKTDYGRLYENAVYLELKRKLSLNEEISYWRNKQGVEADFAVREGIRTKEILQVAYELTNPGTKKREIDGIVACAKELGLKRGVIITKEHEEERVVEGVSVKIIPLWKWLLDVAG